MVCFLVLVFFEFLNTALACGDTLTVLSSIFCLCIKHGFLYHIKSNLRVKEEIISLYTSKKEGVARGPEVIRAARVIEELKTLELDVRDYGDIVYDAKDINDISNMSELGHVASCTSRLSEQIRQVLRDGRQALTIGGDHSLSIGTIDGHVKEKGDVAVIWVDAHADLNTNKTSESGNVHGMPVALLTSELADYWPYLPGMDWQVPMLSIRNVAYIGLRSVDRYERLVIEKFGITAFGMEDIERYGIHNVTHMALNKIDSHNSKSLHVSFDIDALDPLEAPSTGTPGPSVLLQFNI
ncbi:arginase, hepatic isoform X5 [Linepithema humile]|uniref:arginase, hepatic isoform X5 n=1 Tax=Linepithema humile TaxID=83485 RepID=UPI00351DFE6B